MNGLTLLAIIALAIGVVLAYRAGVARGRRDAPLPGPGPLAIPARVPAPAMPGPPTVAAPSPPTAAVPPALPAVPAAADLDAERARLVRAYEAHAAALERSLAGGEASRVQLAAFAEDRRGLLRALAESRAETARYRQLVVDAENDAPSGFLGGPGSADDLKLIVGVGPMLERMLHQLGVTTYRQVAGWSEHDIDELDRRLPEFPGRIRRDAWVTQARALHQSKYGSPP